MIYTYFKDLDDLIIQSTEYAKSLEGMMVIPYEKLTLLIFRLIRVCAHYALFEDEFYLKTQIAVLKESLEMFIKKYNALMDTESIDMYGNSENKSVGILYWQRMKEEKR